MRFDGLLYAINDAIAQCLAVAGLTSFAATRLYTNDRDGVLVADDGSLVSLLRLDGSLSLIGDAAFADIIGQMASMIAQPLGKSCHVLQCCLSYEPKAAKRVMHEQFGPMHATARALELDVGAVLTNWEEKMASLCSEESVYMALWTKRTALPKLRQKQEEKKEKHCVGRTGSVTRMLSADALRDQHISQVRTILSFFHDQHYKIVWLDSHRACAALRHMLVPHSPLTWRPRFLDDCAWRLANDSGANIDDITGCLVPTIARQIWPERVEYMDGSTIRVGETLFAPLLMTLPPQTVFSFDKLFASLRGEMPWRATFLLSGDGLRGHNLKHLCAQVLAFASSTNRMLVKAYDALEEAWQEGRCIVGFQACFCTWVSTLDGENIQDLALYRARLKSRIEAWGSCAVRERCGDPLVALSATIPGLLPTSPAPKALAPLEEVLSLLPLHRLSSPWDVGDLPLRTPDGKFLPIGLFHSKQASWNEVVFAGMGAGKSFFLNTINFFFLLRSGQTHLPWLTVIDIGPSCKGLLSILASALPPEKRHLVVHAKLKNSQDRAINPFDTPLGCHSPLQNHGEFLNNLLCLLCTPLEKTAPADGISGLLREAVDQLYKRLAPKGPLPKRFDPFCEPKLTQRAEQLGFSYDATTTWWEVVTFFFEHKAFPEAIGAQRYAMPVLADLAQIVTERTVAENYAGIAVGSGGECVPEACSRYLISAITEYPILANPTCFSLGAARVIGLDLYDVTPRGGMAAERQSGIMYMMARYVGANHFFMSLDDLREIPEPYREYHRPRLEELMGDPKRLCYDEFHRASCQDMHNPLSRQIIADLATATRESRKLNLSIGLYSQRLSDFPPELVAMATSIYVLGSANAKEAEEIRERFGFTDEAVKALRAITRPNADGATCVALYKTVEGECVQSVTNSAGSLALWAFSTTAEDMRVRDRLYQRLGCGETLLLLHTHYPKGTIKEEIERRKAVMVENALQEAEDIEETIFQELLQSALRKQKSGSFQNLEWTCAKTRNA
ncbi:MAG: hypothetical protein IJS54_01165 [Desulfovibrio sp.]|nr:hypothetical protein [Desulfovibrio sp.]